jgi:parallel beta-helix repeat protein
MRGKIVVALGIVILVPLFLVGPEALNADDAGSAIVVSREGKGDFNGNDERPILAAIKKAQRDGGGTIQIQPGEYLIRRGLKLTSAITIKGTKQTVLKLASPVVVTEAAKQEQDYILVDDTSELTADTRVDIYPPSAMKAFPNTDKSEYRAEIREIEQGKLILAGQIPHVIPENSRVGYGSNLFFVGGSEKSIRVENLVLDGGLKKGVSMPGHCRRCALLAHGIWSYSEGPTAPPIENVQVIGCHIRNCYGRAVAMYSVVRGKVEDCLIEDIDDEGIDLDHFCYHCQVAGNTVKQSGSGVTVNDASYCTIQDNRFEDCGIGVTMWWWYQCPQGNLNVENVIKNNVIISPQKVGISLGRKCFRNKIIGNVVGGGIKVVEADNVLEKNTLK